MHSPEDLAKLRIQKTALVRKRALRLGIELEEGDIAFERNYSSPLIDGMDAYEWLEAMGNS